MDMQNYIFLHIHISIFKVRVLVVELVDELEQ